MKEHTFNSDLSYKKWAKKNGYDEEVRCTLSYINTTNNNVLLVSFKNIEIDKEVIRTFHLREYTYDEFIVLHSKLIKLYNDNYDQPSIYSCNVEYDKGFLQYHRDNMDYFKCMYSYIKEYNKNEYVSSIYLGEIKYIKEALDKNKSKIKTSKEQSKIMNKNEPTLNFVIPCIIEGYQNNLKCSISDTQVTFFYNDGNEYQTSIGFIKKHGADDFQTSLDCMIEKLTFIKDEVEKLPQNLEYPYRVYSTLAYSIIVDLYNHVEVELLPDVKLSLGQIENILSIFTYLKNHNLSGRVPRFREFFFDNEEPLTDYDFCSTCEWYKINKSQQKIEISDYILDFKTIRILSGMMNTLISYLNQMNLYGFNTEVKINIGEFELRVYKKAGWDLVKNKNLIISSRDLKWIMSFVDQFPPTKKKEEETTTEDESKRTIKKSISSNLFNHYYGYDDD